MAAQTLFYGYTVFYFVSTRTRHSGCLCPTAPPPALPLLAPVLVFPFYTRLHWVFTDISYTDLQECLCKKIPSNEGLREEVCALEIEGIPFQKYRTHLHSRWQCLKGLLPHTLPPVERNFFLSEGGEGYLMCVPLLPREFDHLLHVDR